MKLTDRDLRIAYEQSLTLTRQLGRMMRERAVERIMTAIATPCCDLQPNYEAQTHDVCLPDDEIEHIERCGE